jgi:hypothetical protein
MAPITNKGPAYSLLAARVLTVSGGTIVKTAMFYANNITVNPQIDTLNFEGDNTSQQVDQLPRIEIELTLDKLDLADEQVIFGKPTITGVSGETWGMNFGDITEVGGVLAGLEYDIAFKDESVTPNVVTKLRYTYYKGVLKVKRPQTAAYQAKHQTKLNFVFYRTTTDLLNATIPGNPSDGYGAYYREAVLS